MHVCISVASYANMPMASTIQYLCGKAHTSNTNYTKLGLTLLMQEIGRIIGPV